MVKVASGIAILAAIVLGGAWFAWREGYVPGNPVSPHPENLKRALRPLAAASAHERCVSIGATRYAGTAVGIDMAPTGFVLVEAGRSNPVEVLALESLVQSGLLASSGAVGQRRFTLTWPGFAQTDGGGCFVFSEGNDDVEIIRVARKPSREGQRVLEVVYRRQPADLADWARREEVRAVYPTLRRASSPEPATAELIQTDAGWRAISGKGTEGGRMVDLLSAAQSAAAAGRLTPERVRPLLEKHVDAQPVCVDLQLQGDHQTGRFPDNEVFLFNLIRPSGQSDRLSREVRYATFRALADAGLLEQRRYRLERAFGVPAVGAVGFVLSERAKQLVQRDSARPCVIVGRPKLEEILRVEQFGPANVAPRVLARASLVMNEDARALTSHMPQVQRMLEVGIGVRASVTVKDGALQLTAPLVIVPTLRFDRTEPAEPLPVVETGEWVPGHEPPPVAQSALPPSIDPAAWRAGPRPRVTWVTTDPFIHGISPISNSGLTLTHAQIGAYTGARSSEGKPRGRWYLELLLTTPGAGTPAGVHSDFGVRDISVRESGPVVPRADAVSAMSGGRGSPPPAAPVTEISALRHAMRNVHGLHGDVFGIALDLDRMRVHIHRNGTWYVGGSPESGNGVALVPGRLYGIFVSASAPVPNTRDAWTANFGGRPFRYPAPAGFRPFEEK